MLKFLLRSAGLFVIGIWIVACESTPNAIEDGSETIIVSDPDLPLQEDHPFSHEALMELFPEITDLHWSFSDQNIQQQIDKTFDQPEFCSLLSQAIPYDITFNEWTSNYSNDLGDDYGWAQIYPIGKIIGENGTNLFFQTYTQISATNGGFWDIWMIQFEEYHSVDYGYQGMESKVIGSDGYYKFIESGNADEGDDFEYFIDNYEYEKIEIKRITKDSLEIYVNKFALREGYDWRIDQNLSINDSIPLNDIITYEILN